MNNDDFIELAQKGSFIATIMAIRDDSTGTAGFSAFIKECPVCVFQTENLDEQELKEQALKIYKFVQEVIFEKENIALPEILDFTIEYVSLTEFLA